MKKPLKLICLNIEHRRHLGKVMPFLKSQDADLLCLQEVMEHDFEMLKEALGMRGIFGPMLCTRLGGDDAPLETLGVALLSALPSEDMRVSYYYGSAEITQKFRMYTQGYEQYKSKVLLSGIFLKEAERFVVGMTHFTWSADGQADDTQRKDLAALFRVLDTIPEIVLCGDFNAPRGREIFDAIAARYKDNIPAHYTTSLDQELHYTGRKLQLVVDGLFTTPGYRAQNVRLLDGVSDHCAVVADITKIG